MRTLTEKQKQLLRAWYFKAKQNAQVKDVCFGLAKEMPDNLYEQIENIHPTEIHYQNVNNYLEELCFSNAYKQSALYCTAEGCYKLQCADGEFCKEHIK